MVKRQYQYNKQISSRAGQGTVFMHLSICLHKTHSLVNSLVGFVKAN